MIVLLLFALLQTGEGQTSKRLDGAWWSKANDELRQGAVDGMLACVMYDKRKPLPALSLPDFKKKVDLYYEKGGTSTLVEEVLLKLPKEPSKAVRGGQVYKGKYGFFDDLYWQTTEDAQRGFLIGYIACGSGEVPKADLVEQYRRGIRDWYEKFAKKRTTVPEVLRKIRKRSGKD